MIEILIIPLGVILIFLLVRIGIKSIRLLYKTLRGVYK